MKTRLSILLIGALLTGCASNDKPQVNPLEQKRKNEINLIEHEAEINHMSKMFCEGKGLFWYSNTTNFISFTCREGLGSFQFKK